jgi:major vault protein
MFFQTNNLIITSVDIKNMEVTDVNTRENLSKSINIAIEINSQSQEANARF